MLVLDHQPSLREEDLTRTETILKALESARLATPRQLAALLPPSLTAKPISIKKYSKVHEYPDSYDDVVKILRRLEAKGHVKCHPGGSRWESNVWSLPGTKPPSPEFRAHELDITDIFKTFWRL